MWGRERGGMGVRCVGKEGRKGAFVDGVNGWVDG